MTQIRTIQKVDVYPIQLPITKTFNYASGSAGEAGSMAAFVFVKLTDSHDEKGWGAVRPVPDWNYETLESIVSAIRGYFAPHILGLEITDRHSFHNVMHQRIGRGPSTGMPQAKAALDIALHDLCARAANMTLRAFLGGSNKHNTLPLSYTLLSHDADEIVDEIQQAQAQGFKHFNFKVAVAPDTDIKVCEQVMLNTDGDAFISADANQGLSLHDAYRTCQAFSELGLNLLEQPFPADRPYLLERLRSRTNLPIATDEASVSSGDFFQHVHQGLVDFLVIKVPRSGGIFPTIQQIAVAQAAGLGLYVSGLAGTFLTKLAGIQTALAFGYQKPAALNGSQFIDESALYPGKVNLEFAGKVNLDDTPGLGIQPDEDILKEIIIK